MQSSLSGLKCNEYTRELILYDSDFKETEKYREICDTMENALSEYILIMRSLRTECTGVAADNFAAYAELVFVNTYFPDFGEAEYAATIAEFQKRSRRYGGL